MTTTRTPTRIPTEPDKARQLSTAEVDREFDSMVRETRAREQQPEFEPGTRSPMMTWLAVAAAVVAALALLVTAAILDRPDPVQDASGSDVHLQNLADEATVADVRGSDVPVAVASRWQ